MVGLYLVHPGLLERRRSRRQLAPVLEHVGLFLLSRLLWRHPPCKLLSRFSFRVCRRRLFEAATPTPGKESPQRLS